MNRGCEQIIGPCTCGAFHVDADEFKESPVAYLVPEKVSKKFTREDLFALHAEMTSAALELMKKKNADYSAKGPFQNFMMCEARGTVSAEVGILIRLDDKLSRLTSILTKGEAKVKDESITDTLIDVINYAVCLAGILKEKRVNKHD